MNRICNTRRGAGNLTMEAERIPHMDRAPEAIEIHCIPIWNGM
jgi:hypothetical protein